MTPVKYRHLFEITDAKNEYIATLYAEKRGGVMWFTSLWVHADHRKKGHGKALLRAGVTELGHQDIYLQVMGYTDRPLSDEELTDWYGRFGFVPTAVPCILCRPGGTLDDRHLSQWELTIRDAAAGRPPGYATLAELRDDDR